MKRSGIHTRMMYSYVAIVPFYFLSTHTNPMSKAVAPSDSKRSPTRPVQALGALGEDEISLYWNISSTCLVALKNNKLPSHTKDTERTSVFPCVELFYKGKEPNVVIPLEKNKKLTLKIILPSLDQFMSNAKTACETLTNGADKKGPYTFHRTMKESFHDLVMERVKIWKIYFKEMSLYIPDREELKDIDWVRQVYYVIFEFESWEVSLLSTKYEHFLKKHVMMSDDVPAEGLLEFVMNELCDSVDLAIKNESLNEWINDETMREWKKQENGKMSLRYVRFKKEKGWFG